jgi:hypothetical protein
MNGHLPLTTTETGAWLVGVGVARYVELRCWDMTASFVFFSGLNSTMYNLGKNRHPSCTSPLEDIGQSMSVSSNLLRITVRFEQKHLRPMTQFDN